LPIFIKKIEYYAKKLNLWSQIAIKILQLVLLYIRKTLNTAFNRKRRTLNFV